MSTLSTDSAVARIWEGLEAKPAAYLDAARRLQEYAVNDLIPVKLFVLSTFTAEVLSPYLVVEGARRGLKLDTRFGPWGQLEVQVLDPQSALYRAAPDVIGLFARLEDLAPELCDGYASLSPHEREQMLTQALDRVDGLCGAIRSRSQATLLVANFAAPAVVDAGLADPMLPLPQAAAVSGLNRALAERCRRHASVLVFDYARVVAEAGISDWFDPKLSFTARVPFGAKAQLRLGRRLARALRAVRVPPCKCLVVDLDNTLWGGVLGDSGPGGIALGADHPGNVYKRFQQRLVALRRQGILLAVASKNDPGPVLEAMNSHPDMLLRPDAFAAMEINWGDKATSLKTIAHKLSIGLDALAFFDDHPVERAWVKESLPMVTVIDVPPNPMGYVEALEDSGAFDRLLLSDEDLKRAEMMSAGRERERLREQAASVADFLTGLEMKAVVGSYGPTTSDRFIQLLAKTNQFNLTTRRHTAADVERMLSQGGIALWMRLSDRFGDNGLIAAAIALPGAEPAWRIDTFVMSCRVIGRRAEEVLLAELARRVMASGGRTLDGEFLPTAKNGLAASFYDNAGFQAHDRPGAPMDARCWRIELADLAQWPIKLSFPPCIHVRLEDVPERSHA